MMQPQPATRSVTAAEPHVAVRLQEVSLRYGPKIVLERCSLECLTGQVTAVIGPSGAGKSTILRLVSGLRRPDAGHVFVDGEDITDSPERDLIEMRRQTPRSVTLTLRPNVAWGGFAAGQFVRVGVEIDGIRRTRTYSPANSQHQPDGTIELTVTAGCVWGLAWVRGLGCACGFVWA